MYRTNFFATTFTFLLLFIFNFSAAAQSDDESAVRNDKSFDVGLEVQIYPTGIIPGLHFEYGLSEKDGLLGRVGYNAVDHRDLGVQDDETGGGFGFSLGYRRYFKADRQGFFLGARTDLWFNRIDWRENPDLPIEVSGVTDVTVLQPTAEAGYVFNLKKEGWSFIPSIAFGAEINIQTAGRPVGEGAIVLVGFNFRRRF